MKSKHEIYVGNMEIEMILFDDSNRIRIRYIELKHRLFFIVSIQSKYEP